MAIRLKTVNKRQDVYILGDCHYQFKCTFGVTDDYAGISVSDGNRKVDVLNAGLVWIFTKDEILENRGALDLYFKNEGSSTYTAPHYAMIIYDFLGEISVSAIAENGSDLLQGERIVDTYLYDNFAQGIKWRTQFEAVVNLTSPSGNVTMGEPVSIQRALLTLDGKYPGGRQRAHRVPLESVNQPVLSYCAIPEELLKGSFLQECSCDSYVSYILNAEDNDYLNKWIADVYPELVGKEFMIHIDY